MNKLAFYIPLCFTRYTRYQGIRGIATWFFKYGLLVLLASLIHWQDFSITRFVLGVLFTYSLYEYGYIQNDAETIKKEINPTKRLTDKDLLFYEQHKVSIYLIRICFSLLIGGLLFLSGVDGYIFAYSFFIIPVFYIYNEIRSKWNLYIHLVLMFLRISVPIFIGCNYVDVVMCLWVLFIYPFVVFIELSVKGKFGYHNRFFQRHLLPTYNKYYFHTFRVKYYTIFTFVVIAFSTIGVCSPYYLLPTIYYHVFVLFSANKNRNK